MTELVEQDTGKIESTRSPATAGATNQVVAPQLVAVEVDVAAERGRNPEYGCRSRLERVSERSALFV